MIKKLKDIFLATITAFIIMIISWFILINYFWSQTWKIRNGEDFCINKEYSIWKMLWWDNLTFFCDNKIKNKCINWIKSYKLSNTKDLYLHFDLNNFSWVSKYEINKMISNWYLYRIFQNDYEYNKQYFVKNYDEIKRFLKVDYNDCSLKLYSNNDLEILNEEDKNFFNELISQQ